MTTDTSEKGLESLIVADMTGRSAVAPHAAGAAGDVPQLVGPAGWVQGEPETYDREYAVDLAQLSAFIHATQPEVVEALDLGNDSPTRRKFLVRLQGEIARRGVIDVLRHGLKHGQYQLDLFFGTPSPGNETAAELFAANRFSVTRQLRYSQDETQRALDLCLFINGLPVITFELKNSLTKQTAADAEEQYKRDRNPNELLFQFGRCIAHFALDDNEARFCTHLKGKASWFLPFNQGFNDGAGKPPNPNGLKTDYLWKRILTPRGLTDIIENYAQVVERKDDRAGRKKPAQVFPRYHQLDVVRKLLAAARADGVGRRYLIQHSAGSGKSNSIAWLAHQLIGLRKDDTPLFDSIVVVTDRRLLDRQIRDTIKQFAQVGATVGHAEDSGDLRKFIEGGKKIMGRKSGHFPISCVSGSEVGTLPNFLRIRRESGSCNRIGRTRPRREFPVTSLQVAVAEGIGELRLAVAEDRFLANPVKRGHEFSVARIPG
jgi:type I restriction enzyme R subunit